MARVGRWRGEMQEVRRTGGRDQIRVGWVIVHASSSPSLTIINMSQLESEYLLRSA